MGTTCGHVSLGCDLHHIHHHNTSVSGIPILQVSVGQKIFGLFDRNISEFNMRRINFGSHQHHPSNPTRNGETNIFKGTQDMKIFCSKEKMF